MPARRAFFGWAAPTLVVSAAYVTLFPAPLLAQKQDSCDEKVSPQISVDLNHSWTPPFGVDRVGSPLSAHVKMTAEHPPQRNYFVVGYQHDREIERHALNLVRDASPYDQTVVDKNAYFGTVQLTAVPDAVSLLAQCAIRNSVEELTRQSVKWPQVEADAEARPDRQINPVNLGTILVPHDWLLLAGGQSATIVVAAISRQQEIPRAHLRVWFEGGKVTDVPLPLLKNRRAARYLPLPPPSVGDRATLHVSLTDSGHELWKKEIHAMMVERPPHWPVFGAVETKLRYDAPIWMHDSKTGAALPSMDYNNAWDPKFNDVVVFLPNGSRFVFWRGSSYIPFWAGLYNTGTCYQWAENLSIPVKHADGSVDLPEPMNDRELRYGRVVIIESTPSRVHVRWTYQSTDIDYNVWGDQATEDYYFYPDGFGTRVLTLVSTPGAEYQLTEFIVLTPQAAYPFDVLPNHLADVLFLNGEKSSITFPFRRPKDLPAGQSAELAANPGQLPMVYRIFDHQQDPAAAIYFSPRDPTEPAAYDPFYDQGEMVTPTYWGNHWPLGRGKWTGWGINDGINSNPAHNSVAGWMSMPKPLSASEFPTIDTLGKSRTMALQRWAALIAQTDATDDTLLEWAQSYSDPPTLDLKGARVDFPSYSPERRAMRLIAESPEIEIKLKPVIRTVNPVFELQGAPRDLASVTLDGKALQADAYAWDGATLWVKANIGKAGATIGVQFR